MTTIPRYSALRIQQHLLHLEEIGESADYVSDDLETDIEILGEALDDEKVDAYL